MKTLSRRRAALFAALAFALALSARANVSAQDGEQPRAQRAEVNHEVHLHLLVSADGPGGTKVPQSLDAVVRQLKASLPPSDYSLVSTFVHRVREGGVLEVKTAGGSPFVESPQNTLTPTFFQISLVSVKTVEDASGQRFVNVTPFRLGLKVPIQTASVGGGEKGGQGYPVIQYEDTGITTQLSVREGEPTLVGTLNTSRPGQYFALVLTIKRAGR